MVSVIVPIYNVERFLSKCIESIMVQTYTHLEIILVDDGSTDNSLQICEFYREKDTRIKIISQKNQGASTARNAGIDQSQGEYLMFVDSDDWIHPQAIEILLKNLIEANAVMSVGNVFCTKVYTSYIDVHENYTLLPMKDAIEKMLLKGGGAIWGRIFKRELFRGLRFPAGRINEDYAVSIRLLAQSPFIVENSSFFYFHYIRENSVCSSSFSVRNFDAFFVAVDVWNYVVRNHLYCEELVRAKLAQTIVGLSSECCKSKDRYDLYGDYFKQMRDFAINNYRLLLCNKKLEYKYKCFLFFIVGGRTLYSCFLSFYRLIKCGVKYIL